MTSEEECEAEVWKTFRLFALWVYSAYTILAEEFGKEKAKDFISRISYGWGEHRGKMIAEKVKAGGRELTLENFYMFYGKEVSRFSHPTKGHAFCPIYEPLKGLGIGVEKEIMPSICEVDFGLMKGYNPEIDVKRTKWLLDGDDMCSYSFDGVDLSALRSNREGTKET